MENEVVTIGPDTYDFGRRVFTLDIREVPSGYFIWRVKNVFPKRLRRHVLQVTLSNHEYVHIGSLYLLAP